MKKAYTKEYISHLLCRFMNGETALDEERMLEEYFRTEKHIPEEWADYKEMFAYFEGVMDYETAVARIGKNTRVYAKKQLTWNKRDGELHLLNPETAFEQAIALIKGN